MIKATDFIHPEDAAALRQLESIPGFPTLVKKLMSMGLEQLQYGICNSFITESIAETV